MNAPDYTPSIDATANEAAEQAVLGLALFDDATRNLLADRLRAEHFAEPTHADLWTVICEGAVDASLICQRMADHRGFRELGGPRYLADLIDKAPPATAAEGCAEALIDAWTRRSLAAVATEIQRAVGRAPGKAELILHDCERAMAEIARGSGAKPAAEAAGLNALAMLDEAYSGAFTGQNTGIGPLDHVTGGIRPSDVWVIGGRTSMGKSVMGLSIARGLSEQGLGVLFFSLEMPMRECQARLIADLAYDTENCYGGQEIVRYGDILKGRGQADTREQARHAARRLASLPIAINDTGGLTIDEIRSQTLRQFRAWEKAGVQPGAVIIDHIGLVRPERRTESKAADTADTVNELKPLAKQSGAPVIALSQINRGPEQRLDKRPTVADLNWSGAIEQDADLIALLYRDAYYLERSTRDEDKDAAKAKRHELEIIIAKQRAGPICMVKAHIDIACNAVRGFL